MARLRRDAMICGPLAVRIWEAVLIQVQVTNPVEPVLGAPVAADDGGELGRSGLGHAQGGDGVAGFAGPFALDFAAPGDLDGLGGPGEGQAPGYRGDCEVRRSVRPWPRSRLV